MMRGSKSSAKPKPEMIDEIKVAVKDATAARPSIMIATPMYGGMCTGNYVLGLLNSMVKLNSLGIQVFWAHLTNESLITRGRNELTRLFLEKGHDYLMFIDADISFDSVAILQLLAGDRDIACGIYPKKEVAWDQVERAAKQGESNLKDFAGAFVFNMVGDADAATDGDGMIEVRHGGTGFMLIKRRVFETLAPHVSTYRVSTTQDPETGEYLKPITHEYFATSIDESGALLSEDYHFCELWRKHGGKIYAHPFIPLEHVGTYTYTGNILRSGGNLK